MMFVLQAIQEQMKLHGQEPVSFQDVKVTHTLVVMEVVAQQKVTDVTINLEADVFACQISICFDFYFQFMFTTFEQLLSQTDILKILGGVDYCLSLG